ncbi:hypothetical protein BDR06DRAFT_969184 [Suillus hirtellus]|nr:hypothetical protein BDR06DRAFT_969184 [Suillus hirtellus]
MGATTPLKHKSSSDVYILLKFSDVISHDLSVDTVFEGLQYDSSNSPSYHVELVSRKCYSLDKCYKFGYFVCKGHLIRIEQCDTNSCDLLDEPQTLQHFWKDNKTLTNTMEVLVLSSGRDINDFSNLRNKEIQQSTNNDDYEAWPFFESFLMDLCLRGIIDTELEESACNLMFYRRKIAQGYPDLLVLLASLQLVTRSELFNMSRTSDSCSRCCLAHESIVFYHDANSFILINIRQFCDSNRPLVMSDSEDPGPTSAGNNLNVPAGLVAADGFQTNHLEPLKNVDTGMEKIAERTNQIIAASTYKDGVAHTFCCSQGLSPAQKSWLLAGCFY